jgi:proline-rich tail region repeat protein
MEVLRKIARDIQYRIASELTVVQFTPKFMSSGEWVGRLDYRIPDDFSQCITHCCMLEGHGDVLDSVQQMRSRTDRQGHFTPYPQLNPANPDVKIVEVPAKPGRTMAQIENEGPGWERIV